MIGKAVNIGFVTCVRRQRCLHYYVHVNLAEIDKDIYEVPVCLALKSVCWTPYYLTYTQDI